MAADQQLLELPRFSVRSGRLTFMQEGDHIPFAIDHMAWIRRPAGDAAGGDDALRSSEAVVAALAGRLEVELEAGESPPRITLDRPDRRLYIPPAQRWALRRSSADCIALIVTPDRPDPEWAAVAPAAPEVGTPCGVKRTTIDDCAIVALPRIEAPSGDRYMLRPDGASDLRIRRVYYLTDIPRGATRGGHAHRELFQFVVAARGRFEVGIDDGVNRRSIELSRPDRALMLVPGIWRVLSGFTSGSICLVMASQPYAESDYLRQYRDFRAFKKS